MEKVLDKLFTVIFAIALVAILYFVFQFVKKKMIEGETTGDIEIVDDNPFSDEEDYVDDSYDREDEDYYDDDEPTREDIPEEYEDAIASVMDDVLNEEEEANTANTSQAQSSSSEKVVGNEDLAEKGADKNSNTAKTNPAAVSSSKFMVVAGSFASKENAEIHLATMRKEGYSPEIVNFNNSRMHTVIAGRYNTRSSADNVAAQLRAKKYECYVHTRR